MKILITGSAGFIGYNLAINLIGKKGFKITGIDNFNDYYDVNLKKKRNNILKKFKNFEFIKVDIIVIIMDICYSRIFFENKNIWFILALFFIS